MFFFSIPVPIPKHPKSSEDLLHKALQNLMGDSGQVGIKCHFGNGHLLYNTARTDYM